MSDEEEQAPPILSAAAFASLKRKQQQQQQQDSASDDDENNAGTLEILRAGEEDSSSCSSSFAELGIADWLLRSCKELGLRRPTPVQRACVPQILQGKDVLGMAQTGSGKTAAFALPILQKLGENPFGVFALVITPTRELAFQICEQFKALGSGIQLRCTVIVGGMDMTAQAQELMTRPHVVVATPGRIRAHIQSGPDLQAVFSKAKFLVLDEADRLLDVSFQEELRVIFSSTSDKRQTLLFSATMTGDLQALRQHFGRDAFFFQAYEGLQLVESLEQKYIFMPSKVKNVYFCHLMEGLEERNIRSVMVFVSRCWTCQLLHLILKKLEIPAEALHSSKPQHQRLGALNRFKSGQVPILIATDVASRGLDIPTVDLVVNYDIPRFARDYVHRVGRTARAGRGGSALSLITESDVGLIQEIEEFLGKKLEEYEIKEDDVLEDMNKVLKARRAAVMDLEKNGFQDLLDARKEKKVKALTEKGLLKPRKKTKTG